MADLEAEYLEIDGSSAPTKEQAKSAQCTHCGGFHPAEKCFKKLKKKPQGSSKPSGFRQQSLADVECFGCGKKRHIKRFCPEKKNGVFVKSKPTQKSYKAALQGDTDSVKEGNGTSNNEKRKVHASRD